MSGRRRGGRRSIKKVSSNSTGSDGEEETTPTSKQKKETTTTTPTKKKRAPIVKVETLLLEKRWTEVRKRLKRVASPKRIGSLLHHTADNPDVPDDIFKILLSKLHGKREYECNGGSKPWSIRHEFWGCVCNVNAEDVYSKKFGKVCKYRSPTSLRIFLNEYVAIVGKLCSQSARETILYLWADYIFPNGTNSSYTYTEQKCPKIKQEELIRIASQPNLLVEDPEYEVLYNLWQKTELLIKMTVQDGLLDESDEFPLIHTMINVEVPKIIVWLALKLCPEQPKVKDDLGRIPLHWAAAMNNAKTESSFCISFSEIDDVKNKTMVELVLDAYPAGARYIDTKGSHPLALLLDLDYKSWTPHDWMHKCVMALLKQAPEALHETNGENRMLPFLIAACMHDDNTVRARTKCEELTMSLRQLNLSYDILRQDPTVLARGIKDTSREIYLKQQLNEAHVMIQKLEAEKQKLQDQVATMMLNHKNNKKKDHPDSGDDDAGRNNDMAEEEPISQKRCSKRARLNHDGSST